MQSPRLPWEVLERVIGHSGDSTKTLRSLSLTCRQLLPRSRCGMMAAGVRLKSRDHAFALVDFLENNPHLKSFITSITIKPHDLPPFPLLHMLSNLSKIEFYESNYHVPSLNPSCLTCFQKFGSNIQTLGFFGTSFSSPDALAQLLLAFSNIAHLVCNNVKMGDAHNQAPLTVIKKRLSEKLRLRSLVIDSQDLTNNSLNNLLFDPMFKLASSWVESLEVTGRINFQNLSALRLPEWSLLKCLKLHLYYRHWDYRPLTDATKFLDSINDTTCMDVTIVFDRELDPPWNRSTRCRLLSPGNGGYSELEHVLLKFSQVTIIWTMDPLRATRNMFWTGKFKKCFPLLSQCGSNTFILKSETVYPAGHDGRLTAFAISPNGKWTASGSDDTTIILWNTQDGSIAQQWVFPKYQPVTALAFSHNSRYLVVGSDLGYAAVWDLWDINHIIITLNLNNGRDCQGRQVVSCAWSPDGTTIAVVVEKTVKLWNISSSKAFYIAKFVGPEYEGKSASHAAFSPDGTMLVSTWNNGTVAVQRMSDIVLVEELPMDL